MALAVLYAAPLQEAVDRFAFPTSTTRPEVTVDTTGLYLKYR